MPTLIDRHLKIPQYLQLAEHLRQEIADGRLQPDDRLPSLNESKAQFGANQRTVEKAHDLLELDGLIRREPGRGVFVNHPAPRKTTDFVAFLDIRISRDFSYHQAVQGGVRQQAELCGKSITMIDDPATFKHWDSMDGVVLEDSGYHRLAGLLPKGLPAVRLIDEDSTISSVIVDDAAGIAMAVEHLVNLGHRRIGYLGDIEGLQTQRRHQPYLEMLRRHGITPLPQWTFSYPKYANLNFYDYGYDAMQLWLKQGLSDLNLTAILAQNDYAAAGMIQALRENDIQVPRDISIVGYDGIDRSVHHPLRITTIEVPLHQMGVLAMKVLLEHINCPNRQPEVIKLPVRFIAGESTAEPRD